MIRNKAAQRREIEVPEIQNSLPDVFIFESLNDRDEELHWYEGQAIRDILWLCGKRPKYYYFQSRDELPHLINLFRQSRYRFLHLSCHGSDKEIFTNRDVLTYAEFADYFDGDLNTRRLFCSACQLGNDSFAKNIVRRNKCTQSIVAPTHDIQFGDAAAIWSAFYVSILRGHADGIQHRGIEERLEALTKIFPVTFYLAAYHPDRQKKWRIRTVSPHAT